MKTAWKRPGFIVKAEETFDSFTASGRVLFYFFAGTLVLSTLALVYLLNAATLVAAPARGGTLTEGVVGSPRFINPLLAVSDADRDVSALVYSGLLHATPAGDYEPDLAENCTTSQDGKTYTCTLRPDAVFSDDKPVTADDVLFTIKEAQDPALKSQLRANWDGVVVTAIDQHTVQFMLKAPYAPFVENLTLGILPKHLWDGISAEEFPFSDLNTNPIGSGPYRVTSVGRTASGIPAFYDLEPSASYALGEPYLTLSLRFYQNEDALADALARGEVEAASGLSPKNLSGLRGSPVTTAALNRVFGVFFNQSQSEVLRDKDVRAALDKSVDRAGLVEKVLGGYGTPITGPIPPNTPPNSRKSDLPETASSTDLAGAARTALLEKGWKSGQGGVLQKTSGKGKTAKTVTLAFDLSTANVPELSSAAQYLKDTWERMGARITVKSFDQGDLSANVIRPRKFDALLFGEVIGREADLFAFWHSSQRNDPGLNIAGWANATADKALEQLRAAGDDKYSAALYQQFVLALINDRPAVFLYAPDFVYSIPQDIQGVSLGLIEAPSDRFLSVAQWHRETDYVWPFFAGGKK